MASRKSQATAMERLAWLYYRNGYVRRQNPKRLRSDGPRYKKGDEVRVIVDSKAELALVRRLLRATDFKPGSPFVKGSKYAQPVYGRKVVVRFLAMVAEQHIDPEEARKERRAPVRSSVKSGKDERK